MVELNEFDEELAKKVLTTGSTIKDAGKIIGNQDFLSRTNNKKNFGIEAFDSVGRQVQGKQRIYFMKNANFNEMVMKAFNQRLAREITNFYLFGYTLKDIEYVEDHQIANITFIIKNSDNPSELQEVTISFIDVVEINYLVSHTSADNVKYRNVFVLPNVFTNSNESGDMDMLLMETQQTLLSQPTDKFVVITSSILKGKKFYESNVLGDVHHSLSFIKQGGVFNISLFKDTIPEGATLTDHGILNANKEYQLKQNDFYVENGRIVELSNSVVSAGLEIEGEGSQEYVGSLLDTLGDFYPIAMRYFERRYEPNEDSSVDDMLDSIVRECGSGETFIDFETNFLPQFIETQLEVDEDDDEGSIQNKEEEQEDVSAIFDKTAPVQNQN